ncbi:Predicted DNA-binding transcriptional regulator YafY, contains an HTH and WYL domains, partial [Azotobacter beijerinckii]
MSTASARSTLSRQWELLRLLPARPPGLTAQELYRQLNDAGFKVSKRTVERDLNELSHLFPLQCNTKGSPYGWYWTPSTTTELPGLTVSEALTLRLVEDSLRPLLPDFMLKSLEPRFALAHQKLQALGPEVAAARWIDKIANVPPELTLQAPNVDGERLERIQQALLDDRQLACCYFAAHRNKRREMVLNPIALIQRGNITYLAAICEPHADIRLYAAHRFEQVEVLATPSCRPEGFRLADYIAGGALQFTSPGAEPLALEAWIDDGLARAFFENTNSTRRGCSSWSFRFFSPARTRRPEWLGHTVRTFAGASSTRPWAGCRLGRPPSDSTSGRRRRSSGCGASGKAGNSSPADRASPG